MGSLWSSSQPRRRRFGDGWGGAGGGAARAQRSNPIACEMPDTLAPFLCLALAVCEDGKPALAREGCWLRRQQEGFAGPTLSLRFAGVARVKECLSSIAVEDRRI